MPKTSFFDILQCCFDPSAWRLLSKLLRQRQPLRYLPLYLSHHREFIAKGGKVDKPVDQMSPVEYQEYIKARHRARQGSGQT